MATKVNLADAIEKTHVTQRIGRSMRYTVCEGAAFLRRAVGGHRQEHGQRKERSEQEEELQSVRYVGRNHAVIIPSRTGFG